MEMKKKTFDLRSLKAHPLISHKRTFGEKASDLLTKYIGSWMFIVLFILFLISWVTVNSILLAYGNEWDKKPFIILNLILSCLAALQAPIILMSQNRQSEKDRIRIDYDYEVDKKAEREIEQIKTQLNRIEKRLK